MVVVVKLENPVLTGTDKFGNKVYNTLFVQRGDKFILIPSIYMIDEYTYYVHNKMRKIKVELKSSIICYIDYGKYKKKVSVDKSPYKTRVNMIYLNSSTPVNKLLTLYFLRSVSMRVSTFNKMMGTSFSNREVRKLFKILNLKKFEIISPNEFISYTDVPIYVKVNSDYSINYFFTRDV